MEQFLVPQFIEVEPKIIGPITARQFIICLIGAGFLFLAYKLADFSLFVLLAFIIIIITFLFAFIPINGRPFHYFLLNLIQTFKKPSLRIWYKEKEKEKELKQIEKKKEIIQVVEPKKRLPSSRLTELSLIVDTGGSYREER